MVIRFCFVFGVLFFCVACIHAQAVRIVNGTSCGSGWVAGHDGDSSFIVTNAHVAGTRLGRTMVVQGVFDGVEKKVNASVFMAAYSSRTLTDWAILRCEKLAGDCWPLSVIDGDAEFYDTCGSPRCVWPLVCRQLRPSGEFRPWRFSPDAVGGQSGSAIRSDGVAFGLLTWSWGGKTAAQTTADMWRQAETASLVGHPRIDGLLPLSMNAADCEEGFFAEASIHDLPIWNDSKPSEPNDPPSADADVGRERFLLSRLRRDRSMNDWLAFLEALLKAFDLLRPFLTR